MFLYTVLVLTLLAKRGNTELYEEFKIIKNGKKSSEDNGEWKGEQENYNFPEFDKIASFLQPLTKQVENAKCRSQLKTYVKSLKNSSLWAVQMFDASAKIPQGLLSSDAYDLGNYDGCIEINLNREVENILGKYCLVTLKVIKREDIQWSSLDDFGDVFMKPEMTALDKFMVPILRYGFTNNICRSAICVPNHCTARDVENMYTSLINRISGMHKKQIIVSVSENACSTNEIKENRIGSIIKQVILGMICAIAISTIFDVSGWCDTSFVVSIKISKLISAYSNYKSLVSTDRPGYMPALDTLKVYAVIIFVITRRLSFLIEGPIINRKAADQVFHDSIKKNVFQVSNDMVADTLLVLQGFINFTKIYYIFQKNPKMTIFHVYLAEFLKSLPLYMFVILLYVYLLESIGNGPMWIERTENPVRNCKSNWLLNLLYLNNFLEINKMCISESWYFAVMAQCFIMTPIVVRLLTLSSVIGYSVIGLLSTIFIIVSAGNYEERAAKFKDREHLMWHQKVNISTTDRAFSYFLGIIASFLYIKMKDRKYKFSKEKINILSCCATAFIVFVIMIPFLLDTGQISFFQSTIINILRQFLWSLSISWIIIKASFKKPLALTSFLTHSYLAPLGGLTYSYLLVLGLVQLYTTGTIRTLDYFSFFRVIWMSTSDLLATYIFAFIFYMMCHKPISIIVNQKILEFQEPLQQKSNPKPGNKSEGRRNFKLKNKSH